MVPEVDRRAPDVLVVLAGRLGRAAEHELVDRPRPRNANSKLADLPVGDGKRTEPEVLKAHLDELFATWPSLRVLTGDALFCQRPLAHAIIESERDYVLVIKDNQPDLLETAVTAFADATAESAGGPILNRSELRG
jgi:hypothetical protein